MRALAESVKSLRKSLSQRGDRGDHETNHMIEDKFLWNFVHYVYSRSTEPCIQEVCLELIELENTERTRWYA